EIISPQHSSITVNMNTYNFYKDNVKINENISKNFENLAEDPNITNGYQITRNGKNTFSASTDEFSNLSANNKLLEEKVIQFKDEAGIQIIITRLPLDGNKFRKWEFSFNGNRISASMKDEEFLRKMEEGNESFKVGDKLVVDLKIKQILNAKLSVFENTGYYEITKVIKHINKYTDTKFPNFDI
ncbi:MAG: hypothetical protein ACYCUW_10235, partial [bacterium]